MNAIRLILTRPTPLLFTRPVPRLLHPWRHTRACFASSHRPDITIEEARKVKAWTENFTAKSIPVGDLEISYCRSSGPGGQNVNKVETKVEIRLDLHEVNWIPDFTKQNLRIKEPSRITKMGELKLASDSFRTQKQNQADVIQRLYALLMQHSEVPKETTPEKKAKIKRLARVHNERRLNEKKKKKQSKKGNWKEW